MTGVQDWVAPVVVQLSQFWSLYQAGFVLSLRRFGDRSEFIHWVPEPSLQGQRPQPYAVQFQLHESVYSANSLRSHSEMRDFIDDELLPYLSEAPIYVPDSVVRFLTCFQAYCHAFTEEYGFQPYCIAPQHYLDTMENRSDSELTEAVILEGVLRNDGSRLLSRVRSLGWALHLTL